MKYVLLRLLPVLACLGIACAAFSGTLTVTSPTAGAYLGLNNTLQFNINGASQQVTVTAVVTDPNGNKTTKSDQFTPTFNGQISGSLPLNFNNSSPEGQYTIVVSATEPNNTYADSTVTVNVIVNAPKFLEFSPNDGQYVRGTVKIRALVKSAHVKDWTVQVNGQDIPANTGTGNSVAVDWDTTNVQNDGSQVITILVRDLANNSTTQTLNVTLDRVSPTISIAYPGASTHVIPNSMITVLVDVSDASSGSVDVTGVDVYAKTLGGAYIARVARISFKATGASTNRWTGRIRYVRGLLPSSFKLVVTAVDRAGNAATPQETTINIGRNH